MPQPPSGPDVSRRLPDPALGHGCDRAAAPRRRRAIPPGRRDRRRRGDGLGRSRRISGSCARSGSTSSTPFLADDEASIVTWGSSFSALAAGRRWSLTGDAGGSIEVDSTWIHLGPDARPARIGEGFDGYAEATQGRVASTKLTLVPPPIDGPRTEWPLRTTDVDRMGHVNNAAYWAAVEQRLGDGRARSPQAAACASRLPPSDRPRRARRARRGQPTTIATASRSSSASVVKAVAWVEALTALSRALSAL